MAEMPRADTDDFACRSWRYWCLTMSNRLGNLSIISTLLIARSLPLIIVDNCPHMHTTGFFPDCWLLSVTNGCIWIPYLARYLEIFKKPNLQVVKCKPTFIWKMLSQAELRTEGSGLATIFGLPPAPRPEPVLSVPGNQIYNNILFVFCLFGFRRPIQSLD